MTRNRARMPLADKLTALKMAGFTVQYAIPSDGHERGYVRPSEVSAAPYVPMDRPYVDLGSIARGDDRYDQTTTWERSNFRRIMADYPGLFVPTSYSNVDSLAAFVADLTEDTLSLVIGLATDYPVYDDSDVSALEWEEIGAAFDQYGYADWVPSDDEPMGQVADLFSPSEVRDAFYAAMSEADYYPEHNGLDVLWDDDQVSRILETALCALVAEHYGPRLDSLTAPLF